MNILFAKNLILVLIFGFGQSVYCTAPTVRKFVKKEKVSIFTNAKRQLSEISKVAKSVFNNGKVKLLDCGKQSYKQFIAGYAVGITYYGAIAYKNDQVSVEHFANFRNKFMLAGTATYLGARGIGGLFKKADDLEDNEDLDPSGNESLNFEENTDTQYVVHPLVKVAAFMFGFYAGYKSLQFGVKFKFPYVAPAASLPNVSAENCGVPVAPSNQTQVAVVNGIISGSATKSSNQLLRESAALLQNVGILNWGK